MTIRTTNDRYKFAAIGFIVILFHFMLFGHYFSNYLAANIDNHLLTSEMWGMPEYLREFGLRPFFTESTRGGWDGQFYFYVTNDIFLQNHTSSYIDIPGYRYQRIGFSIYAKAISLLLMQAWVSPAVYFFSYSILVLTATFALAIIFRRFNINVYLSILWATCASTIIPYYNGLPDAAADSFLIIALASTIYNYRLLASILFTLSALSREVYVVFPVVYLISTLIPFSSVTELYRKFKAGLFLMLPAFVLVIWKGYLYYIFGIASLQQPERISSFPLSAFVQYIIMGFSLAHPLHGSGPSSLIEASLLTLFIISDALVILFAIKCFLVQISETREYRFAVVQAVVLYSTAIIGVIYLFLGPLVVEYFYGYVKLYGIILISLIIIAFGVKNLFARSMIFMLLCSFWFLSNIINIRSRVLTTPPYIEDITLSHIGIFEAGSCIQDISLDFALNDINLLIHSNNPVFNMFGNNYYALNTKVKNNSGYSLKSQINPGGVRYVARVYNYEGKVISQSLGTAFKTPLMPDESRNNVIILLPYPLPVNSHHVSLGILQIGCPFAQDFYDISSDHFKYIIK